MYAITGFYRQIIFDLTSQISQKTALKRGVQVSMSRSYLSDHSSPVKAVLQLLWMISALLSVTLFPFFLFTALCPLNSLIFRSLSMLELKQNDEKAERFDVSIPLIPFIISDSCLRASEEVCSSHRQCLIEKKSASIYFGFNGS